MKTKIKELLKKVPNYWIFPMYMLMMAILFSGIGCMRDKVLGSSGGNGTPSDTTTYVIYKNNHYCTPRFTQTDRDIVAMRFYVQFDSSVVYKINDADSNDINKVYGYSYGLHHDKSIRLGFNWKSNQLMLHNYCYFNGKSYGKRVKGVFKLNVPIFCALYFTGEKESTVSLVQEGRAYALTIVDPINAGFVATDLNYYLYPYFGGQKVAPRDIKIKIWGVRVEYGDINLRTYRGNYTDTTGTKVVFAKDTTTEEDDYSGHASDYMDH
jgi:hypothetical protein